MPRQVKPTANGVIAEIADLLALLRRHQDGIFLYRGEDAASYPLRPKLGRQVLKEFDWSDIEETLIDAFKRRGAPYLTSRPHSELQWLTLAQHHGLATRLLDWTQNPLVALFFAVATADATSDCVLYALRTDEMLYVDDSESPFALGKVVLHEPSHVSPRVTAQRGVFSIHPDPTVAYKSKFLERWVVKRESVVQLLVDVETLGITYEAMFPGLDSVARQANADSLGI